MDPAVFACLHFAEGYLMKADNVHIDNNTRGDLGRWIGLLLSASAWAAQLQALYLTSEYGCDGGGFTWNDVVFAVRDHPRQGRDQLWRSQ